MAQAVKAYHNVSSTQEFRMLERMREDMRNNEITALNRARRQEKKAIARAMLAEGMDVDTVARLSGLFIDDILRLQSE